MMAKLKIVGVTNCPAGIAHTYMVAEAIEQRQKRLAMKYMLKLKALMELKISLHQQKLRLLITLSWPWGKV